MHRETVTNLMLSISPPGRSKRETERLILPRKPVIKHNPSDALLHVSTLLCISQTTEQMAYLNPDPKVAPGNILHLTQFPKRKQEDEVCKCVGLWVEINGERKRPND